MIAGRVNAEYEPLIQLELLGHGADRLRVEAIVDTGFNGWLSLPPRLIAALELPWLRTGRATLADGHTIAFDIYEAKIVWNGAAVEIPIDESDSTPLIGMRLMDGFDLNVVVRRNGLVALRPSAPA